METETSQVRLSPVQGDFATGVRTKPDTLRVRGSFATGMTGRGNPAPAHHGDFGAGLRSRRHHVLRYGDFARGLREGQSAAGA